MLATRDATAVGWAPGTLTRPFPEARMAELTRRYVVMTMASEAPFDPVDPEGVFVLKPWKDPAALRALEAYRENCYPDLARDLDVWIAAISAAPAMRGDVGRRNEPYVRTTPAASARAGSVRARQAKRSTPSRPKSSRPKAARTRRATPGKKKRAR